MIISNSNYIGTDGVNISILEVFKVLKNKSIIATGNELAQIKDCFIFMQENREDIIQFKVLDLLNPIIAPNNMIVDYPIVFYLAGTKEDFSELKKLEISSKNTH